jgi:hypothetical protein
MSAGSFDFVAIVEAGADGAELGEAVGSVVAEADAAVGTTVADVRAGSAGGCGPAIYPASATPAASRATSANGASIESAPRLIGRIFIELDPTLESNDAQRRCRDTTRV